MRTTTKITLAVLLGAVAVTPAMAVTPLVTSQQATNSNTTAIKSGTRATASGTTTAGPGTGGPVSGVAVNITKFDTNTGILIGSRLEVAGVNTSVNTRVAANVLSGGTAANRIATATSSGFQGTISGSGFTSIVGPTVATSSRACSNAAPCTTSPSAPVFSQYTLGATGTLAGVRSIDAAALGNYAANDGSSVSLNRTADGTTSIQTTARTLNATANSQFVFNSGTYTLFYDYLKNATASFEANSEVTTRTLDFGRIGLGGSSTLFFTLHNVADAEGAVHTAGAQLLSINRALNEAAFSSNVTVFTNLVAANSNTYSVTFAPTARGSFSEVFTFNFKDYALRTGSLLDGIGVRNSSIELTVMGSTVPEPETWALLLAGFGMVGFSVRRRRRTVAA